MSNSMARLREAIDDVEKELQATSNLDPVAAERLHTAIAELRTALEEAQHGGRVSAEAHTTHSIRDAIERFEVSHPTLTGLLSRLIDALAQLGI